MYSQTRKLLLASSLVAALMPVGGAIAADVRQDITEARQESQIWTTYALNPYLRAMDLKVSVHNGKATLTGTVDEDVNKELAKQVALGVSGIKQVDNQIVVKPDYAPAARSADRSFGDLVDDATITSTVKSKLLWSRYTDGLATGVDTRSGKVTLTGKADSAAERDLAAMLAMNTRGVVAVDNQLKVDSGKAKPTKTAKDATQGVADTWITAKVKSTFAYSSNVRGSDITVSTDRGIVTLSGKLDSGVERSLAIELAKNVRGVKSVESKGLTI